MIVLMAGLPGTGKSTLAEALCLKVPGTILNKDKIRHAMFGPSHVEYSIQQDDFVMEVMLSAAEYILKKAPQLYLFLDGRTFSRRYQVARVIAFAEQLNQSWRILECQCSEETARARLMGPSEHPAANRDYALYLRVKSRYEPIAVPKTVIDTDLPLQDCLDKARRALE